MKNIQNAKEYIVFALRIALGWLFFYAGFTKVLNPDWTSAGYLEAAKTFSGLYHWLASPDIIPFIDFINEWGLTLLGVSLILGLWMRWSIPLGALLMLLYYLPILDFPYPNPHSFIVDEHIVYALALLALWALRETRAWSLDLYYKIK